MKTAFMRNSGSGFLWVDELLWPKWAHECEKQLTRWRTPILPFLLQKENSNVSSGSSNNQKVGGSNHQSLSLVCRVCVNVRPSVTQRNKHLCEWSETETQLNLHAYGRACHCYSFKGTIPDGGLKILNYFNVTFVFTSLSEKYALLFVIFVTASMKKSSLIWLLNLSSSMTALFNFLGDNVDHLATSSC